MRYLKAFVWLVTLIFLFSGMAEAGKEKKKEREKVIAVVTIVGDATVYDEKHIGRDPYLGNLPDALKLMGYSSKDINWLNVSVMAGEYAPDVILDGEKFLMTSGRNKVGKFIAKLKKPLDVKKYISEEGMPVYYIPKCGNWVRKEEIPQPVTKPPVIAIAPPSMIPVEQPVTVPEPEKIPEPKVIPAPRPEPVPIVKVPPTKKEEECETCVEHEPIIGAYGWQNELARGYGFFGEYMLWIRKCLVKGGYAPGWSPGLGVYGFFAGGESRLSSYNWTEKGIGPETGLKYIGETKEGLPYQWQGKLRLVWENQSGGNKEGYGMKQDNLKLGFYSEFLQRLDYQGKWIAGVTVEGWITIGQSMTSTWSGDSPQSRATAAISFLAQYKVSDDWSIRGSFGGFYQGWDKLFGLRVTAEARYKETFMFGPSVAFFPFGLSSIYNGISPWQLTTWTGFIRAEFGLWIREWDAERRSQRVKQIKNPIANREDLDKI
jgi:hypothetical protein